jgi:hypothetical protein
MMPANAARQERTYPLYTAIVECRTNEEGANDCTYAICHRKGALEPVGHA